MYAQRNIEIECIAIKSYCLQNSLIIIDILFRLKFNDLSDPAYPSSIFGITNWETNFSKLVLA